MTQAMNKTPDAQQAMRIATNVFGEQVDTCSRFDTGLRHWVYDVVLQSGRNVVIRLSHPDNRAELAGGLFWQQHLEHVGVPVAAVLAHDINNPQPFVALERLAGTDLGNCFDQLNEVQLRHICTAVAEAHERTRQLPRAVCTRRSTASASSQKSDSASTRLNPLRSTLNIKRTSKQSCSHCFKALKIQKASTPRS